jgi:hypothetical protein
MKKTIRDALTVTSLERENAEFDHIEQTAQEIIEAFRDRDPLPTVMALRLAAQRIYDTRCRERHTNGNGAASTSSSGSSSSSMSVGSDGIDDTD